MANQDSKKSNLLRKILLWLIFLLILGLVLTYFAFNYTYSEGNRAGVIIKFSKKGYMFKTYEGELNLGGLGNIPNTAQMNVIWEFSVREQAVADTLMHLEGRKVSLHYRQVEKNLPWQGETPYFVDGVQLIDK